MKYEPLNDHVLVEPDAPEQMSGSIYLPDDARKNSMFGTVVAVGPGRVLGSGDRMPLQVKVGQRVLYGWGGSPVQENGKDKFLLLRECDILAIACDG